MIKFKLRTKLLSAIILTTALVFGAFLYYNNLQLKKLSRNEAIDLAKSYAENYAIRCKDFIDIDMGFAMAISNASQSFYEYNDTERDSIYGRMFLDMLKQNPKYISVWNTIELQYTNPDYHLDFGRRSLTAVRYSGWNEILVTEKDMNGHNKESVYYAMKQSRIPGVMEPYKDDEIGDFFITTVMAPIFKGDNFVGLGGMDFSLDLFQDFIDQLNLMKGASAFVCSNKGVILGHTNADYLGDSISRVLPEINKTNNLVDDIQNGKSTGISHSADDMPFYTAIVPFNIEGTNTPWAFSISLPIDPFLSTAKTNSRNIFLIGIIGLIFIYIIIYLLASQFVKPLSKTTKVFKQLALGNISSDLRLKIKTRDELEDLSESVNKLINCLQATENFAGEIEKGNLDAEYELLSPDDRLGNALIRMRDSLQDASSREENRKIEDERRNWALDGVANFAELLRENSGDFKAYINKLVSSLARYTDSNIGSLYLIKPDDENSKILELAGSYAYANDSDINDSLEFGEGLIGVSIQESRTIRLDELPKDYLSISSGLGSNSPNSLIICPLKHNDEVIGAIELASFSKYKDYQESFIEKIADNIASTIHSIKIQQKSKKLLDQSQVQSEQMLAQEEELRQTMEEMMATQEENARTIERLQAELKETKLKP